MLTINECLLVLSVIMTFGCIEVKEKISKLNVLKAKQ